MVRLSSRQMVFVGGKGGVGKTTCAAAIALLASRGGRRVLLVSTDPAHSTGDIFEARLGPDERQVAAGLSIVEIDAERESTQYLDRVMQQVAKMFSPSVVREAGRQMELAASMPGAVDVAVFDRVIDLILSRGDTYDLIVFDTAPTGHTLRLLRMPELMGTWVDALSRHRQAAVEADDIVRMGPTGAPEPDPVLAALKQRQQRLMRARARLSNPTITAFIFVLIPERLPIEETSRAIAAVREAQLDATGVIVNRVLPASAEGAFVEARRAQEQAYRAEIDRRFGDLARVSVPQLERDVYGIAQLERISAALRSWM